MIEKSYELPLGLKSYYAVGTKVDFDILSGVVSKENFLSPAKDVTEEKKSFVLKKPESIETSILDKSILDNINSSKISDMNIFNSFNTSIR